MRRLTIVICVWMLCAVSFGQILKYNGVALGYDGGIVGSYQSNQYSIEAQQYFDRLTADLTTDYKDALAEFIDTLARDEQEVWDSLSFLHLYLAAQNKTDALIDLIGNYDGTELGTLTYKAKLGMLGGDNDDAVNTGFIPKEDSNLFKLNNSSWGIVVTESADVYGNYHEFGTSVTDEETGCFIRQGATYGRFYMSGVNDVVSNTLDTGFFAMTRIGTTNTSYFNDNIDNADADPTENLASVPLYVCAARATTSTVYESPRTIGLAWAGTGFSQSKINIIKRSCYRLVDRLATIDYAENLIYRTNDTLYIASKFDDTSDIVIRYSYLNYNLTTVFSNVTLNDNSETYISKDIEANDNPICTTVSSDNISPTVVNGYFIGGGHTWTGGLWTDLASDYTALGTTMTLVNTTDFVATGGLARASDNTYFTYTGLSGNDLTGVICSTSISTGDSVRITPSTAGEVSVSYKIDGVEVGEDYIYADSVNVSVKNAVYDMSTLNRGTGAVDTFYYEYVDYVVRNGQIEVNMEIEPVIDYTATLYYGVQVTYDDYQDSIYFASDTTFNRWDLPNTASNSGFASNYPCYRIVLSNADKTINGSVSIDQSVGFGIKRYLASDRAMFINPNNKTYNNFVSGDPHLMDSDSTYRWKATYNWFNNENYLVNENFTYAYPEWSGDSLFFFVDTHDTTTDYIDVSNYSYTSYEVIDNNGITFGTLSGGRLPVSSTGYARAKIYLK